ncbi:MAG: hypothetical protein ACXWC1_22035, partial [Burkholderiales bacterium]
MRLGRHSGGAQHAHPETILGHSAFSNESWITFVNVIGVAGERNRADYIAGSTGNAGRMAFTRALGSESVDH